MKNTPLVFLSLLLTIGLSAQKRLKMDIIKSSGDTMYSTSERRIYVQAGRTPAIGEYLKTTVYRTNGNFSLCFSIQTGRTNIFSIGDGAAAEIALKDGNKVLLYSRGDNRSKSSSLGYGCFMFAFYGLPSSAIRQLKASGMISIRIHASLGPMDYDIKDKFSDDLLEQLAKFDE